MFKQNLLTYISVSIVDAWKPCWTYLLPTNDDDDDDTRFELGECQLSRGEIFNPENLWKLMQVSFKRRWLSADIWTRLGGRMIIKTSGFRITCYVWQTLLPPVNLKSSWTNLNIREVFGMWHVDVFRNTDITDQHSASSKENNPLKNTGTLRNNPSK